MSTIPMINPSAIQAVFERSLQLKKNETCLIVTDPIQKKIASSFFEYVKAICADAQIIVMPTLEQHGQEPPDDVANAMLEYDVELLMTSRSISHTKARRAAKARGARIASMPMITEEIINRTLDVNYNAIRERSLILYELLLPAKTIHVTTALGTDIYIERRDMKLTHGDGGILNYPSAFGNLPEGEVSVGPGYAYGSYVVDASFPCFGKMDSPLQFTVKDTHVIEINGKHSQELRDILNAVGPNAYRVAELGIGVHPTARVTGIVLEDEKTLGTCHIALGNNMSFGGTNDVPLHLDGVILNPTVYADERLIMDNGKSLF